MNGYHLMIPFQYELFHFRNLKGVDLSQRIYDLLLIRTIRRANKNAFCSREPGTVEITLKESREIIDVSQKLGL